MKGQHSLQVQSVIYNNEVSTLEQALDNLANAIEVDRNTDQALADVTVCYGDASGEPVFSNEKISEIKKKYERWFAFSYTFFQENTGTAKGHNRMGRTCHSRYMLIMNPDVVVNPHFFGQMLEPFERDAATGMTEARQTPVEHHKQYDPKMGETSWATTAAAIFPTALFRQLHGFDADTFFMYCDDVDFSWRIRMCGYKVIYVPQAVVFHAKHLGRDANWIPTNAEMYYSVEAALLMAYKWSDFKRAKRLLHLYKNSKHEFLQKAAQAYIQRQREGRMPEPIDPQHKVADFVDGGYGESRFRVN